MKTRTTWQRALEGKGKGKKEGEKKREETKEGRKKDIDNYTPVSFVSAAAHTTVGQLEVAGHQVFELHRNRRRISHRQHC